MCIWISVHVLCNVSIFVCFYCTFVLLSQQWLNKDVQSINQSIKITTTTCRGHKSVRQFVRSSGLWMSLQFFVRLIPPQDHLFRLILVYLFIHLIICYLFIYSFIYIYVFFCVCVWGGGGHCVACHLFFFTDRLRLNMDALKEFALRWEPCLLLSVFQIYHTHSIINLRCCTWDCLLLVWPSIY